MKSNIVLEQVAYIIYVMSYIAQPTSNFHVDWILQPLQFSLLPVIQ